MRMESTPRIRDCGHCFCEDCLSSTLKLRETCPLCLNATASTIAKDSEICCLSVSNKTFTGVAPLKTASQPMMKKSISVVDLGFQHEDGRGRRHSDGMAKLTDYDNKSCASEERCVSLVQFAEKCAKYSTQEQTVEFRSCDTKCIMHCEPAVSGFNGKGNPNNCPTEDRKQIDITEASKQIGAGLQQNCREYNLNPGDLIHFEELTVHCYEDKRSNTVALEQSFGFDAQLSRSLDRDPEIQRIPSSEGKCQSLVDKAKAYRLCPIDKHKATSHCPVDGDNAATYCPAHDDNDANYYPMKLNNETRNFPLDKDHTDSHCHEGLGNAVGNCSVDEDSVENQCPEDEERASNHCPADENNGASHCLNHGHPYTFLCLTCDAWGCPSCPNDDQWSCFVLDAQEGVHVLTQDFKENAKKCGSRAIRIKKMTKRELSSVKVIYDHYDKRAAELKQALSAIEYNLSELRKVLGSGDKAKSDMDSIFSTLKEKYIGIRASNSNKNLTEAMKSLSECNALLGQYSDKIYQKVSVIPNIQLHKKEEIISLLAAGAPIYGTNERNGTKKYSQLTLEDEGILVHCLREDVYPNEGVGILVHQFKSLSAMLPEESSSIFFDIGWAGEKRGRVVVELFGNRPRSRQTLLLCSGEKGPSYLNTNFYSYCVTTNGWLRNKHDAILYGGDYEHNNGSGGKAIIENIIDGEEYNHKAKEGLMVGWPAGDYWRGGSFGFYLSTSSSKIINTAFGAVTQNLGILKAAAEQNPVTNSFISDCGFIIPF